MSDHFSLETAVKESLTLLLDHTDPARCDRDAAIPAWVMAKVSELQAAAVGLFWRGAVSVAGQRRRWRGRSFAPVGQFRPTKFPSPGAGLKQGMGRASPRRGRAP
eukprot:317999-Chlamydomonas_euryale.AAC.4